MKNIKIALLLALFASISNAYAQNECPSLSASKDNQVLVGWITNERTTTQWSVDTKESKTTKLGPFRIVAAIKGDRIVENIGSTIRNGQTFWQVPNSNRTIKLSKVGGFLDHMGYAHCVYYASIETNKYPKWTLFTSRPDPRLSIPNKKQKATFYKLNNGCVHQGDPIGKAPPCTKPSLLAISDINRNGKPEYWSSEPYKWDDGLTVWELHNGKLVPIIQVCVGCSD